MDGELPRRSYHVEEIVRSLGDRCQVILVHVPTQIRVEVVEATDLLAKSKAWTRLRDKLEGWTGG